MGEPNSSAAGVAWLIKIYGWKLIAGVIAVVLGFLVLWPKSAKEGVSRIAATIIFSMLYGTTAVEAVRHYFDWLPLHTVESQMPVFVAAGLPAWWVIGMVIRFFDRRKNRDIVDIVQAAKDAAS